MDQNIILIFNIYIELNLSINLIKLTKNIIKVDKFCKIGSIKWNQKM